MVFAALQSAIQEFRKARHRASELRDWRAVRAGVTEQPRGATPRMIVVSPDPWTFNASIGDQAMIAAFTTKVRAVHPDIEIHALIGTEKAAAAAVAAGFKPMMLWRDAFNYAELTAELSRMAPDIVALFGADVMDGYYNPLTSARILTIADLAARTGADVTLVGFSFNTQPAAMLKDVFEDVHPGVRINLRDPVSYERFRTFAPAAPANLAADVALLLEPAQDLSFVPETQAWIAAERAEGRRVMGFNIHPMLFPSASQEQVDAIITAAAEALIAVAAERNVSFLLIPHDYRGQDGDARCLRPIAERLANAPGVRFHYLEGEHSAPQLKAVARATDGVVGARMHLLIATLGRGRPVAAITYQGKFAGLYQHFGIDESLMLSPPDMLKGGTLAPMIVSLFDRLDEETARISAILPDVRTLSARNLPEAARG